MNSKSLLQKLSDLFSDEIALSDDIIKSFSSDTPKQVRQYYEEITQRSGKKMRVIFLNLISALLQKKKSTKMANLGASVELLHLASLVHDDIIDESDYRRNKLAAHRSWGVKKAVLIGDFLLSASTQLVLRENNQRVATKLSQTIGKLIEGEMLEFQATGDFNLSQEKYFDIIYGKTASLWETCGYCASLILEESDEVALQMGLFGKYFGLAYQISDDLMDYSSHLYLGKEPYLDLNAGVITLPLICFFEDADKQKKEQMQLILSQNNGEENISKDRVLELLNKSSAIKKTEDVLNDCIKKCVDIVSPFLDSDYKQGLLDLCTLIKQRAYA